MNYISLCDGIGAAHVAWQPLGWKCLGVSEIDPFCNAVVEHHFGYENLGALDEHGTIEKIAERNPDVIIGGTPCQSFSIAGARGGIENHNGQLVLWFLYAIYRARPRYFIWENVPGVFSIDKGAVLRSFVASLAELGYVVEWRVLDAQFFGVPQRRRRIFVVGHSRNRCAREILFEPEGMPGNSATGRRTQKVDPGNIAKCLRARGNHSHRLDNDNVVIGTLGTRSGCQSKEEYQTMICDTVTRKWAKGSGGPSGDECQNLVTVPLQEVNKRTGISTSDKRFGIGIGNEGDPMYTLQAGSQHGVAETITRNWHRSGGAKAGNNAGVMNPVIEQCRVRRLTPRECERLQGFPDDYTFIPYKTTKQGKVIWSSDTQRYESIGNSMAVPVIRWIGERIREHHER